MYIVKTNQELEKILSLERSKGHTIGFVPTMGALHQGHLNLVNKSLQENHFTVVSIFINPKQFNNTEDFEKYPIKTNEDIHSLESVNCSLLYLPEYQSIYPDNGPEIRINLEHLNLYFEGPKRPGHFDAVVWVVYRLFELVNPNTAYFGLKDFQQCKVIQKLTETHFNGIELVFCETVREVGGLAMSSRNARLSQNGKILAQNLYHSLLHIKLNFLNQPVDKLFETIKEDLAIKNIEVEYLEIANAKNLLPVNDWQIANENVVLIAAYVEGVRLIDNIIF
jgi:pantoate--beta-alanine ligase